MRYKSFLTHVRNKDRFYKLYLVTGRDWHIRSDILYLMHKKMRLAAKMTFVDVMRKVSYNLVDIIHDLDCLVLNSDYNTIQLEWTEGLLSEEKATELIVRLSQTRKRHFIIVDEKEVLTDIFKKIFGKGNQKGVVVTCNYPWDMKKFVSSRAYCVEIDLSEKAQEALRELPLPSLLNAFRIMEYLKMRQVTFKDVQDLELLHGGLEFFLKEDLFEMGKAKVLRTRDLRTVDFDRFLTYLHRELLLLLRIKDTPGTDTVVAGKLLIDLKVYKEKRKPRANSFEHRELWNKIGLVLRMRKYSKQPEAIYLFMNYW